MASTPLYGSALPSPLASIPHIRHVAGMNWVQPIAPADDGPMLQPKADSTSVIEAMILQSMPNERPAPRQIGRSWAVPAHRRGLRTPVRTLGLRPSEKLLRPARCASATLRAPRRRDALARRLSV